MHHLHNIWYEDVVVIVAHWHKFHQGRVYACFIWAGSDRGRVCFIFVLARIVHAGRNVSARLVFTLLLLLIVTTIGDFLVASPTSSSSSPATTSLLTEVTTKTIIVVASFIYKLGLWWGKYWGWGKEGTPGWRWNVGTEWRAWQHDIPITWGRGHGKHNWWRGRGEASGVNNELTHAKGYLEKIMQEINNNNKNALKCKWQ